MAAVLLLTSLGGVQGSGSPPHHWRPHVLGQTGRCDNAPPLSTVLLGEAGVGVLPGKLSGKSSPVAYRCREHATVEGERNPAVQPMPVSLWGVRWAFQDLHWLLT